MQVRDLTTSEYKKYTAIFEGNRKNSAYIGALKLLGDYYGHLIYWAKGNERAVRFFKGAWNRSHIKEVANVMHEHDPAGLYEGKFHGAPKEKLEILLNDLKDQLNSSKIPLKSDGELAKRIRFIQAECNLQVFDFGDVVEKNKLK